MAVYVPTADEVAVAIVAAARECSEDPTMCAEGFTNLHCRHYAAHALARVFPDMLTSTLARMVGSGSPSSFWTQSRTWVQQRRFKWWRGHVLERVVKALSDHVAANPRPEHAVNGDEDIEPQPEIKGRPPCGRPSPTPLSPSPLPTNPLRPKMHSTLPYRPAPHNAGVRVVNAVEEAVSRDRDIPLRSIMEDRFSSNEAPPPVILQSKSKQRDILREAVENTRRMTPPPED